MPTKEERKAFAKDRAEQAGLSIVKQFQTGDLPDALAPIFLNAGVRCIDRLTGWTNLLLVALSGWSDAATFRQWEARGRMVRKGEKMTCSLFRPMSIKKTDKKTGEDKSVMFFTCYPVAGIEQTDIVDAEKWAEYAPDDSKVKDVLASLPLREVADHWDMTITAFTGRAGKALGMYAPGANAIAIGVEDPATFLHELVHKADDMLGNMIKGGRKSSGYAGGEVVAELGGCILLTILGFERGADRGGAFKYISGWSDGSPVAACQRMLKRTCEAVALILATAKELGSDDANETMDSVAAVA